MANVVAEVKIVPLGTGSPSVSPYVARAVKTLEESGLKITQGAGFTTLEGNLKDVLAAVEKAHNAMFQDDVQRVATTLVIDERRDKNLTVEGKLKSLNREIDKIK